MILGGDRWVAGRRAFGGLLWSAGLLCLISGSGGILVGGPINFWSILAAWL